MAKVKITLTAELVIRVRSISNPSIYDFVRKMLSYAPSAFYERPASTRHHALDERGVSGNILHTIRVADLVLVIADIRNLCASEKDILVASAILHDLCRHGIDGKSEHSVKDHPLLVRKVAEMHDLFCDYYDLIMRTIESHMGRWGKPARVPSTGTMAEVLHIADCINARWLETIL